MNSDLVQHFRFKLQRRVRKLNSAGFASFRFSLKRFWHFLNDNEIFVGLLDQAAVLCETAKEDADKILGGQELFGETENEEVGLAYWVIKGCVECTERDDLELQVAHHYGNSSQHDEALEHFKDMFIEPLYEYLDEQLDDQRLVLSLLRRYKHSCEWFRREKLLGIYDEETERGKEAGKNSRAEKRLALDVYEYLHDQGMSFSIEPSSVSGEADLIASQDSDDPLVADVKIFAPGASKNKAYLLSGFQQVYQYTLDYNEPFGYLVIFKTCAEGLAITCSQQEQSTSFVIHNGKTVFFVVIDLYAHEQSASKRGKLKSYVISEEELFTQQVEDEAAEATPAQIETSATESNDTEESL